MKCYKLVPDIYPITFYALFGKWKSKEAHEKTEFDEGQLRDPAETSNGKCWDAGPHQVIWCPRPPTTPEDISVLVHELSHAVLFSADHLGFERPGGDEFVTYAMQWLTRELLSKYK